MLIKYCACGLPLHYGDSAKRKTVEAMEQKSGPDQVISYGRPTRAFLVQRHYLALHSFRGSALPSLGFPEIIDGGIVRVHFLHDDGTVDLPVSPDFRNLRYMHIDAFDVIYHFFIPKLRQIIDESEEAIEKETVPTRSLAGQVGEIDEAYAARMEPPLLDRPGIICLFRDGTRVLVDGHHRVARRIQLHYEATELWLVPEYLWKKSLLKMFGNYG